MLLLFVASCLLVSASVVHGDSVTSSVHPVDTATSPPGSSDPTPAGVISVNGAAGPNPSSEVSVNGKDATTETPTLVEPLANLTVVNGSFAELSCVARTDGRNVVIVWLQSDEFKVLFYGSSRVAEDKRMSVRLLVEDGKTESTLRISPVLDIDQGKYICRLPRKEKIYTESMYLTVVAAEPDTNATTTTAVPELSENTSSTSPQSPQTTSSQSPPPPPSAAPTMSPTSETTIQSTTTARPLNDDASTTNPELTVTAR